MNLFKEWMELMGFNGKQVSEAGRKIGINNHVSAGDRYRGKQPVRDTDLLAMSAIAAGLEPWSPEYHSKCLAVKAVLTAMDDSNK